ncbi:structure-specific endonuclease subunit SLX1 homolog [Drosophila yakuba]|uniref:structure-specific endonuclease subunit SLX1 homolog n=1 Tax=Drosophila yakuba TaxID=7245 RepID=UPI0019308853|nr:structure-specific endonuclease subunit SLX1 homolog [Drosophila yakuba]
MSSYDAQDTASEQEETVALKGHFYGVYLLASQSLDPRYRGKCYVGFTVNPKRRIRQHNLGYDFGGARKTSSKGPWLMIMIVHGFPNNTVALQFEWAWQQPSLSTRLKMFPELKRKLPRETFFDYNFRILGYMLDVSPWNRLPLSVRWLEADYERPFNMPFPNHMEIVSGKVSISASQRMRSYDAVAPPLVAWASECHLCMQQIVHPERSRLGCTNPMCRLTCHMMCLANYLLGDEPGHYIPVGGECPLCENRLSWAALLQRKRLLMGVPEERQDHDEDRIDDVGVHCNIEEAPEFCD